jgi:hypothetical protein
VKYLSTRKLGIFIAFWSDKDLFGEGGEGE